MPKSSLRGPDDLELPHLKKAGRRRNLPTMYQSTDVVHSAHPPLLTEHKRVYDSFELKCPKLAAKRAKWAAEAAAKAMQ